MAKAETIRRELRGKLELRLARHGALFYGLADGKILTSGDDAETVWQTLPQELGKLDPRYFGWGGARTRFLEIFSAGFEDPGYAAHERDYKLKARAKLASSMPLETALTASGAGEAVLAAYRATNLLASFEMMRIADVLRSPQADAFVRAAAAFTLSPDARTLKTLELILTPFDCAKWTVITYLPFLWQPETHMFLKPTVTTDFAARVGHGFASAYEPKLDIAVYEGLRDLAARTAAEIADLNPRDRIDLQSFIWVIGGAYGDAKERFTDSDVFVVKTPAPPA